MRLQTKFLLQAPGQRAAVFFLQLVRFFLQVVPFHFKKGKEMDYRHRLPGRFPVQPGKKCAAMARFLSLKSCIPTCLPGLWGHFLFFLAEPDFVWYPDHNNLMIGKKTCAMGYDQRYQSIKTTRYRPIITYHSSDNYEVL